ncbi:hypothetical protein PIB30_020096 [Stylosanthes scabra]|uniref:Fe2OG dioxygenase domain-containing protein n=1 Tax=Stylosanthes scabra TaxID=79078 RepID=A0ABU6W9M8_9FABA|nr:hypothetical protein [Stylosanthes scabra]
MNSMSAKLLELNYMILKMIQEGYDLPKHYITETEDMLTKGTVHFRLMKYKAPSNENKKEGGDENGLVAHTDKNTLTILFQNDVQGLEVQTKSGKWIQLEIPHNAYVVIAWSNGRLHAANHRVTMKGDKERYSVGVFTMPKDEAKIEVPPELVDANTHPLRYKPFT